MMVTKIMIRDISNKIIIMVNIQTQNSMTGISRSNRMVMQGRSMFKDNITKNSTMRISITNKTKYTIR